MRFNNGQVSFRQLRDSFNNLTEDQLDMTATIFAGKKDEFFGVVPVNPSQVLGFTDEAKEDRLDDGHPYFCVDC